MRWLVLGARLVLGVVFVYAALTKLPNLGAFAEEVANYRLVPAGLAPVLAATLPGVELVAGLLLCVNRGVRAAAVVTGALLVLFMASLSMALARGIDLRCGCFGGSELATWTDVARDAALAALALVVGWKGEGRAAAVVSSP